jgi:hypothetical protein
MADEVFLSLNVTHLGELLTVGLSDGEAPSRIAAMVSRNAAEL